MGEPTRTLIAGNELLFRAALAQLLAGSQFQIVPATAARSMDLIAVLESCPPDVDLLILLDFPFADPRFVEALKRILDDPSGMRVVVLSGNNSVDELQQAITLGLHGFLLRSTSQEALLQALSLIMMGETVFPMRLAAQIMRRPKAGPVDAAAAAAAHLSAREMEILTYLVAGAPNKIIARECGVSEATVKMQIRRLLRKINCVNRTQGAIWALEHLSPAGAQDRPQPTSSHVRAV